MSERYGKLFDLPENIYAENSPVVISAGTLLKDNQTGKLLVQLKIKNILTKTIKAVKIKIEQFDITNNPIDKSIEYEFLDLSIERNGEFGQKTPIILSDITTRSFKISILKVVFSNNDIWHCNNTEWYSIKEPETLENAFCNDLELAKQYRNEFGNKCKFLPLKDRDIWICSCGSINKCTEEKCHKCKCIFEAMEKIDLDSLNEKKLLRLKEEEKATIERKQQESADKTKKKKIFSVVFPLLVVFVLLLFFATNFISKCINYNNAVYLRNSSYYEEAILEFEKLENFKDTPEQIKATKYEYALDEFKTYSEENDTSSFENAVNLLEELGDYKDSKSILEKEKERKYEKDYERGIEYLEEGDYLTAKNIFKELGNYNDSKEIVKSIYLLESALECESEEAYEIIKKSTVNYGIIGEAKKKLKKYSSISGKWKKQSGKSRVMSIRYDYASNPCIPPNEIEVSVYWTGVDKTELTVKYEYTMADHFSPTVEYIHMSTSLYSHIKSEKEYYIFYNCDDLTNKAYLDSDKLIFEDTIEKIKAIYEKS